MAFQRFDQCKETVSLLRAVTLGAGDACILMSTTSILTLVAGFVLGVLAIVLVVKWLIARNSKPSHHSNLHGSSLPEPTADLPFENSSYDGGPIRSTGAWRD